MKKFGLIGYPLTHSFSRKLFLAKFEKEKINNCSYDLYPLKNIQSFPELLKKHKDILGLNVTIPYKESIIPYLDALDDTAKTVEAVNTIKITDTYNKGYNTDVFGFTTSIKPLLSSYHNTALILGTGGAAKAIAYSLKQFKIKYLFVSSNPKQNLLGYNQLTKKIIQDHLIIINATPLGMADKINACPPIPYKYLTKKHLLFDLIYNPSETLFLKKGQKQKCNIKNGLEMLYLQAEKSWEIWNKQV